MLSPAERAVVARDKALPGLELLLDGQALADRLGLACLGPAYLRYKPRTKCLLAFGAGQAARMAIACPPARYAVLRGRRALAEADSGVRFFDDLCVAVLPAHLDRDLRSLARLADPMQRARIMAELLPGVARAELRLLRHNPARRAVLRLDVDGVPFCSVKLHAGADWARARDNAFLAQTHGGPRVLGVIEKRQLILHEWVPGHPLWSPDTGLVGPEAIRATGAALARLHQADPGTVPATTQHGGGTADLTAAVTMLAALLPALGDRAQALAHGVAAHLIAHEPGHALLHGDFSADQVVIGKAGPVLIDWDRACIGDPARDLGSFLARLDVQAIDGTLTPAMAARAGEALLSGYATTAALPHRVRAQRARALLMLLPEGFRQRRPDWPERATAILDQVEALLPRAGPADDPFARLLTRARDPHHANPLVAAASGLKVSANAATLLRLRPGRRALLRFPVTGTDDPPALLGKLRAKGAEHTTPTLHEALRKAGLDGRSPWRVNIPRPRGTLADLHLWLQDEVLGHRLTHALRPEDPAAPARQTGAALALLHASGVAAPRHWTLKDEIETLAAALHAAANALPTAAFRIKALLATARAAIAILPPAEPTGIHRDWYPDQVLIDDANVWLLDLDLYAHGNPAIDLGNFLAHVTDLSIRRYGHPDALACHEAAFIDGYRAAGGSPQNEAVAVLKAASLARLVAISLRIPDRRPATDDILLAAEAAIHRAIPHTSVT